MSDIYRIFCDYINENKLINENDHIITGLSGGADSVCLCILLKRLSADISFRLTAVHVNHHIRGIEADADEQFVKDFCRDNDINCVAVGADVRKYAFEKGLSLEEAGRIARYQTFYQVAKKICNKSEIPPYIKAAVAHHSDDNAETILMNMIRGARLNGLSGMKPASEMFGLSIIRPMLCLERAQIEEYLKTENIRYRNDSTNNEDEFARNKIRLNIIPELQKINSRASFHINEAANAIVDAQEFIEDQAKKSWQIMVDERTDGFYIALDRFTPLHDVVKTQIIRDVIEKLTDSLKDITKKHVESVLKLQNKQTGRRAELPYNILAIRSYGNIIMRNATPEDKLARDMTRNIRRDQPVQSFEEETDAAQEEKDRVFIIDPASLSEDPQHYELENGMVLELRLVHVNPVTRQYLTAKNEYTKAFDCAKIKGNLFLRKPSPQDVIHFFGGSKSIKKYFVDEKIPKQERAGILLLTDENNVMWIIGHRMSEAYKITEMTNLALQATITGSGA